MFVRCITLALCLLLPSIGSLAQSVPQPASTPTAFTQEINAYFKLLGIPGLSIAVVQEGKLIYRQTEGFADLDQKTPIRADHIFHLASLTKTFTSVLLRQYQQEGKIDLEDYLLDYPFLALGFPPARLNPNTKLKHFQSHTSEGVPGTAFVYNGNRYNFVYGVFEQITGQKTVPQAFPQEVVARILEPLHLTSTITGATAQKTTDSLLRPRIVTSYLYDPLTKGFKREPSADQGFMSYPGAGLMSSIDDLAAYSTALNENRLLTASSYQAITFQTPTGRVIPYGFGWSVQRFGSLDFHWAYGYGDSNSALLIRVPQKKLTFILLANGGHACEPYRLGYAELLRSPFAVSFVKHVALDQSARRLTIDYERDSPSLRAVFNGSTGQRPHPIYVEELLAQAITRHFTGVKYGNQPQKAQQLVEVLYETNPGYFQQPNLTLLHLLAELSSAPLQQATETAIQAYLTKGYFHPEAHYDVAQYYQRTGRLDKALLYYHQLADSQGFEEQSTVIKACNYLGRYYLAQNEGEKGRLYL